MIATTSSSSFVIMLTFALTLNMHFSQVCAIRTQTSETAHHKSMSSDAAVATLIAQAAADWKTAATMAKVVLSAAAPDVETVEKAATGLTTQMIAFAHDNAATHPTLLADVAAFIVELALNSDGIFHEKAVAAAKLALSFTATSGALPIPTFVPLPILVPEMLAEALVAAMIKANANAVAALKTLRTEATSTIGSSSVLQAKQKFLASTRQHLLTHAAESRPAAALLLTPPDKPEDAVAALEVVLARAHTHVAASGKTKGKAKTQNDAVHLADLCDVAANVYFMFRTQTLNGAPPATAWFELVHASWQSLHAAKKDGAAASALMALRAGVLLSSVCKADDDTTIAAVNEHLSPVAAQVVLGSLSANSSAQEWSEHFGNVDACSVECALLIVKKFGRAASKSADEVLTGILRKDLAAACEALTKVAADARNKIVAVRAFAKVEKTPEVASRDELREAMFVLASIDNLASYFLLPEEAQAKAEHVTPSWFVRPREEPRQAAAAEKQGENRGRRRGSANKRPRD